MNFYEFYQLLNENTVSQELKKRLSPENLKLLMDLFYKHSEHLNLSKASKDSLIKWYIHISPWHKNSMQVSAYHGNDFYDWWAPYNDFLVGISQNNNGNFPAYITSKLNNPNFTEGDFMALDHEYHENLKKKQRNISGAPGKNILSFPDGYSWVDLGKGYCDIESKAMGHCGNAGAKNGDTILSLRDNKNIPHLTFILNNGVLGEMKGRSNDKPSKKYHSHIIELLKLPIIKKIAEDSGYLPENNFKLSDLTQEQAKEVVKVNKNLEKDYLMLIVSENTWKIDDDEYGEALYEIIKKHPEILERYDLVYKITENDKTPPEVLKILLDKKYPGASQNIQDKLTFTIKLNLIANKNTPKEVLDELATEDGTNPQHYLSMMNHYNRFIGSGKNKIPSTYLNKVALYILNMLRYPKSDNDEYGFPLHILQHVAENPNTSVETLNKIIEKIELVIKADLINDRKDLLVGDRLIDRLIDNNKVPEEVKAELMKKRKEFYPK